MLAGVIITRSGIGAAFVCHAVLALAAAVPTALLPLGPLKAKVDAQSHRAGGASPCCDLDESTEAAGGRQDVQQSERQQQRQVEGQRPKRARAEGGAPSADGSGSGSRGKAAVWEDSASEAAFLLGSTELQQPQQQPQHRHRHQQLPDAAQPPGPDNQEQAAEGALLPEGEGLEGREEEEEQEDVAPLLLGGTAGLGGAGCKQALPISTAASRGGGQAAALSPRVNLWRGMVQLLSKPEVVLFFCQALLIGFGVGSIENYLFLYLDELGGCTPLGGESRAVGVHTLWVQRLGVRSLASAL